MLRILLLSLVVVLCTAAAEVTEIHVCNAGEPKFLGTYFKSEETKFNGVSVFSNANDMSFFRNNNFWYLGDLSVWPPNTHYRCVEQEGCNHGESVPPTNNQGVWTIAIKSGKEPIPTIQTEPCSGGSEEL